ncbi:transglutaminase-like domain-containing protein [Methanopyrus sp.]
MKGWSRIKRSVAGTLVLLLLTFVSAYAVYHDYVEAEKHVNAVRARMGWPPLPSQLLPYCDRFDLVVYHQGGFVAFKVFIYPPLTATPPVLPQVRPGEDELSVVRTLALFVSDTMEYDIGAEPPEYVPPVLRRVFGELGLEGRWHGACGTAAYMFSYLCRLYGIPTRLVLIEPKGTGTLIPRAGLGRDMLVLHAQVQIWVHGRWITVDPSVGLVGNSDLPVQGHRVRPDGTVLYTPEVKSYTVCTQGPLVFWDTLTRLVEFVLQPSASVESPRRFF